MMNELAGATIKLLGSPEARVADAMVCKWYASIVIIGEYLSAVGSIVPTVSGVALLT